MANPDTRFSKLDDKTRMEGMDVLKELITMLAGRSGSDLHIRTNRIPYARVNGHIVCDLSTTPMRKETVEALVVNMVTLRGGADTDLKSFEAFLVENMAINFSCSMKNSDDPSIPDVRLRVNVFNECNGGLAFVARILTDRIRPLEELGFEPRVCESLKQMAMLPSGLVLVTGPTGSGKTTTLAALINHINTNRAGHIITIEDPVEIIFPQYYPGIDGTEKFTCLITQREVYVDTPSFKSGLEDSLRQDPDVILVGEIRTMETMEAALGAAETGHLVFATLHTNGGYQTINRIISTFPADRHDFVTHQIANNLRCVVSQTLLPSDDNKSRVLGYEYLEIIPKISAAISENHVDRIPGAMEAPCVTWNDRLEALFKSDKINDLTYKRHRSEKQN
jgi:twitching motility protein PilT